MPEILHHLDILEIQQVLTHKNLLLIILMIQKVKQKRLNYFLRRDRNLALCWFEWVDATEKNPYFKSRIMCLRLKSFDWISDKRSFQSVPIKVPYFSLAQRKVPKENRPFCTPGPKEALLDSCSRICPPNHSPLPFRRWRNNAHPLAEAVEVQLALAAKRPKKNDSLFAAFEKSPTWKMTGRSWPIRLRRIGKELLFDPPQAESSIPSMNAQGIFRRFFVSRSFLRHFFLKKVAKINQSQQ